MRAFFAKNYDKINWFWLSMNPNAISILEQNLDKVNWSQLSKNPNAIRILEHNLDKVDWFWLSMNPNAISILEQNLDKVNWSQLSQNPAAIKLLEQGVANAHWSALSANSNTLHLFSKYLWYDIGYNETTEYHVPCKYVDAPQTLDWMAACENPNPAIVPLLAKRIASIFAKWPHDEGKRRAAVDWEMLSANPTAEAVALLATKYPKYISWQRMSANESNAALDLLESNMDCICWRWLSINTNPRAIRLLERYPEKIYWPWLSENVAAGRLLEQGPIHWRLVWSNPGIFA